VSVTASECNLIFALSATGALVSVADVPRGAACGCTCPGCGANLIAAQGDILAWHFRHESDADCTSGYETMAHLLAKEILYHSKVMKLPALVARRGQRQRIVLPERIGRLGKATQEPWWEGVRPDLIVAIDNTQIAVEILVTHRVEADKAAVFEQHGMPAIEIDLSAFRHGLEEKAFREAVLLKATRSWIFHKALAPALASFEEQERQEQVRQILAAEERERKTREDAERAREYQRLWNETGRLKAEENGWTDADGQPIASYSSDISTAEWTLTLTEFQLLDRLYAASSRAHSDISVAAKWMRTPHPALNDIAPMEVGKTVDGFRKCMEALAL
jgi:hypothetical protein